MEEILNYEFFLNNIKNDIEEDLEFAVYIVGLISIYLSNEQKDKFDNLHNKQQQQIIESLKLRRSTLCNMPTIEVLSIINKYINNF